MDEIDLASTTLHTSFGTQTTIEEENIKRHDVRVTKLHQVPGTGIFRFRIHTGPEPSQHTAGILSSSSVSRQFAVRLRVEPPSGRAFPAPSIKQGSASPNTCKEYWYLFTSKDNMLTHKMVTLIFQDSPELPGHPQPAYA